MNPVRNKISNGMKAFCMIPTYNEAANIGRLIKEILTLPCDLQIAVVDDSSPDGTGRIVDELAGKDSRIHAIHRRERGRGTAGIAGFRYCLVQDADFIIEMDGDFSHQPRYIPELLKAMENCDLAIGSRLVPGAAEKGRSMWRRVITRVANLYIRLLLQVGVRDCTSGFRCFRREVLACLDWGSFFSRGPSIVEEILFHCHRKGFRIREIPITLVEREEGRSTLNLRLLLEVFFVVTKLRWRKPLQPRRL